MRLRRPRLLALLLLGWSCLARGELDEIQSRLLAPYALPLRWDNIEAAPAWLRGIQPVYRKDKGYHTIRLAEGEWTEVHVATGEQLRLTAVEGTLTRSGLRLMVANGSGLYVETSPQPSDDGRHWIIGAGATATSVYRLERIGQGRGPLEIALFASRHAPLGELAPYRRVLPLPGQAVALRAATAAAAQTYWRLESGQPVALKVTGPRRLALDGRMLYPASESGLLQSWQVQCWLDDRPLHTAEMESNVESMQEVFVDRASTVVSRAERFYLEIPPGEHRLRLRASAPLLARLLAQESTDYLFPALNQPRLTAEAARADLDPDEAGRSSWQRGRREIEAAAMATANVSAVEHAALRLAMDTRWREGGSVGTALLAQAALARPEDQTLAARARHFSGAHTFFRDLLPADKTEPAAMTYRWFRLPHLLEPGQEAPNLVVAAQHREALLDRLGSGYFLALPPRRPAAPAAILPPPTVPTASPESVREVIQFEPYSARLTQAARARLQALAQRQRPLAGGQLEIRGYTASDKVSAYNQRLSQRRATAVAEALAALGLKASVVKATGRGSADPVADNASRSGRQQNRRVEVTWQPPAVSLPPPVTAPAPRADGARYLLPPAYAPRTLRLVAYGADEAEFFLQIDRQAPRRLRFAARDRLPDTAFAPTPGEGGLLLQRLGGDARGDGSMSPGFGRHRVAAAMVAAASIELILPAASHEIRLWRAAAAAGGVRVAVQYQAAAAFQLSEREFLSLFDLDQDSGLPLRLALRAGWQETDGAGPERLASQWRPLARWLLAELRQAAGGVRAPPAAERTSPAAGATQRARAAAAQGQWLLALEEWSRVWFARSRPAARDEAEWGRIDALGQLGEDFMYEQLLKQVLLFDPDPEKRGRALDRLEKHYAQASDEEARLRLYAIAVQRQPDALVYWRKLTQALLEQGEFRLALLAGLALPPRQRPTEALLEASWRLRWWQTFDRLRLDLEDAERRAFWQGMRAIAADEFETARRHWRAAGNDGRTYADHLARALALRQAMERAPRLGAGTYDRWAEWQSQAPGPRRWRDAPEYVSDFAGALPGYAIDRDLHFSLYKASAERPLRLTVTGPARLRLEARPIHSSATGGNLEGWLTARSAQGLWVAPIIANQANTGLQLADGTWVGRKVALDIPVAAGRQSIEVAAGALAIAVRVYVGQPALPLGALPAPPWPEADDRLAERLSFEPVESTWLRPCAGCLIVPDGDPQQPSRQYRRVISPSPSPPPAPLAEAPVAEQEARWLAENDFDRLLAGLPLTPAPPGEVLKRLVWLLWIAETSPPHGERALAAGQALAAANPGVAGLARLNDRLTRNSGWSAQEVAQESAGARLLPVAGWQPESPSARLQKALLPPLADDEQVIGGHTRLLLSLRHGKKGWIDFALRPEDLGGLPPQAMQVAVQRDAEAPRFITLAPDEDWQTHRLDMPAGHHALRFWLPSPVANQLLRLRLRERRGQAIIQQLERPYQIATAAQPLRALLPGPAWLRVDEWRAGQTHSRYQLLSEPWQTVTLTPAAGQREALFRLHLRSTAPARPVVPPRPLVSATLAVPPPPLRLDAPVVPASVHLADAFALGAQEDGTWTAAAGAHSRYDADSDTAEKYLEGTLTHRYYDPARQTYFTTQGRLRLRAAGDPTLGLTLHADRHLAHWPLDAFAESSVHAQTLPFVGNDWSAHLKAGLSQHRDIDPMTWHTPWLTAYARKTGAGDALNPERVDQDIHTRYQAQHRLGYEIGDRLSYRPWLDSLLQAGLGVTSNQNLVTPDKARLAVQWQQLLGRWQADAHAAWTHYFYDADRVSALDRRELGLRLAWEGWRPNQDRLEVLFDLTHHVDAGFTSGWLGLRWHLEHGRGYRDWPPGTVDFRDLRQRTLPDRPNNRIEAGEP